MPSSSLSNTGSLATNDITCILDIAELDAWDSEIQINYNTPANTCAYTEIVPYAFYSDQPGRVDVDVFVSKDATGAVTFQQIFNRGVCATTALYSTTAAAAADMVCNALPASPYAALLPGASAPSCYFDYSTATPAGPNCCVGTWTMTTSEDAGAGARKVTTTTGNFNGKASSCLAGPAVDTQTKDILGNPRSTIKNTYLGGTNQIYKVKSPSDKDRTIFYNTNYFDPTYFDPTNAYTSGGLLEHPSRDITDTALPTGLPDPLRTDTAYSPTTFNGINLQVAAQPYYEFRCLDAGHDLLARIRFMVRAWDVLSSNTLGSIYSGGSTEGGTFSSFYLHDHSVWRDYPTYRLAGAAGWGMGTSVVGAGGPAMIGGVANPGWLYDGIITYPPAPYPPSGVPTPITTSNYEIGNYPGYLGW